MRFFVENIDGKTITIEGSEAHHIKNVLRKKTGDAVFLFDGKGNEYKAEIVSIPCRGDFSRPASSVKLKIVTKTKKDTEPKIKINLYQSIPKLKKFDFIIEKSTELGVSKIIPVISERTQFVILSPANSGINSAKNLKKLNRWQKIALSASKQCGRTVVPEICSVTNFQDAVKSVCAGENPSKSISLIPWECEQKNTLKTVLQSNSLISNLLSLNLFIGPEGGFSNSEIELACKYGVIPVTLGKRVLRSETAPIVVISNILYEWEG